METTIEFCIFDLFQVPLIRSNWYFWFVGPNLPKEGISRGKQKKWTSLWILHIRINVSTKFHKLLIKYLNLIKSKCRSSCSPCSIAVWKKPQVYLLKKYDWMRHHVNYRNRFQLKRFSVYWTNIHFLSFNKKNCWWFCATQHGLIYQNA